MALLVILLLSDIHLNYNNIDKLIENQQKEKKHVDYIFYLGDFDNLKLNIENPDQNECQQSEQRVQGIFDSINKVFNPKRSFFIPGNHDSYNFFVKEQNLGLTENIHNKILELEKDLFILGFGGSVSSEYLGTDEKVPGWEGYPYLKEETFQKDFDQFILSGQQKVGNNQCILLTHMGPDFSQTSIYNSDKTGKPIQGGSQTIGKLIKDQKLNILANCHGHVHDSQGMYTYKTIRIINDGPLKEGKYAYIELNSSQQNDKVEWVIRNVQFGSIN